MLMGWRVRGCGLPVDIAELVFTGTAFERDGYIEGAAGGDCAADAGHDYYGYVVKGDVGCGFRDEHETFVHAEEVTFVGFDAAFDPGLLVMASVISVIFCS